MLDENVERKTCLSKEKILEYLPFFLLGLFLLPFFLTRPFTGDDLIMFLPMKENYSLWDYTVMRYETWSSRHVIEVVLYYLVHHFEVWAVLNTICSVFCCWLLGELWGAQFKGKNWILLATFLCYPMVEMSSAGWIATTTNYWWVLTFFLFQMLLLKKCLLQQRVSKSFYIGQLITVFYTVNQEQSAVLLFCSFILAMIYIYFSDHLITKKIQLSPKEPYEISTILKKMCPILVISGISVLHHLTCPGNAVRSGIHGDLFFSVHSELSILEKLELGFTSTNFEFLLRYYLVIFVLFFFFLTISFVRNNNRVFRCVQIMTCCFTVLFLNMTPELYNQVVSHSALTETSTGVLLSESSELLLPSLMLVVSYVVIGFAVYFIFEDHKKGTLFVIMLLAGYLSRIIMGFSPTIWISHNRTFIFMHFTYLILQLFLYEELYKIENKKLIWVANMFMVLMAYLNLKSYY